MGSFSLVLVLVALLVVVSFLLIFLLAWLIAAKKSQDGTADLFAESHKLSQEILESQKESNRIMQELIEALRSRHSD